MNSINTPPSSSKVAASSESFSVPPSFYWLMRGVNAMAPAFIGLGNLESKMLASRLSSVQIDRPIYICGLSRAGTTISAQMLDEHPDVATHHYSDFVMPYLPWAWNRIFPKIPIATLRKPVERVHRDRLEVTRDSVEDVEEMIWERFFGHPLGLDAHADNPAFEHFFSNHIRKLLLVRGRTRYMTKSILGASRLRYLRRLFPDARILLYVRNPIDHVASMIKQDRIWQSMRQDDPRQLTIAKITGHHGFGHAYVPLNVENSAAADEIRHCRDSGHAVRARALHWASVYSTLLERIAQDPDLAKAVCIVRYEDLCEKAGETIDRILAHTGLSAAAFSPIYDRYLAKLSFPDYYRPNFTSQEATDIVNTTGHVAEQFGYDLSRASGFWK